MTRDKVGMPAKYVKLDNSMGVCCIFYYGDWLINVAAMDGSVSIGVESSLHTIGESTPVSILKSICLTLTIFYVSYVSSHLAPIVFSPAICDLQSACKTNSHHPVQVPAPMWIQVRTRTRTATPNLEWLWEPKPRRRVGGR